MRDHPSVCIGLPVRNGEPFLARALDSVLAQTYGDFELVVSDNASTDGTRDIVRAYAAHDRRIRLTAVDRNIGAGPNFVRVRRFCRSPFFKWLVHDDLLAPTWLERCLAVLKADDDAVLAHTAVVMIDDRDRPLPVRGDGMVFDRQGRPLLPAERLHLAEGAAPEDRFRDVVRRMSWCLALQGLVRNSALDRARPFGNFYGGDFVLLAELALLGPFRQVEEALYMKRIHAGISVHKSGRERARWADPTASALFPDLRRRVAFFEALSVCPLTLSQRLSCLATLVRVNLRNPLLHRLLPQGFRSLPLLGPKLAARDGEGRP